MRKFLINNKNYILIFTITLMIGASIGVEPGYLLRITNDMTSEHSLYQGVSLEKFKVISLINIARGYGPILSILLIFIIFVSDKNRVKYFSTPVTIFLFYNIFQIIGFFLVGEDELMQRHFVSYNFYDNFIAIYLAIQSLAFCFLLLFLNSKDERTYSNYIKFLLIFISAVYLFFLLNNLHHFFYESPNLNLYATDYNVNHSILIQAVPRSSGVSRILLLVVLALIAVCIGIKLNNKINKILLILIIPFLISLIYLFSSRFIILNLLFFILLIPLFFGEIKDLLKNYGKLIMVFILAYLFSLVLSGLKNKIFLNHQISLHLSDNKNHKIYYSQINYEKNFEIVKKIFDYHLESDERKREIYNEIKKANYDILFRNNEISLNKKLSNFISFFVTKKTVVSRMTSISSIRKELQEEKDSLINMLKKDINELINLGENGLIIVKKDDDKLSNLITVNCNNKRIAILEVKIKNVTYVENCKIKEIIDLRVIYKTREIEKSEGNIEKSEGNIEKLEGNIEKSEGNIVPKKIQNFQNIKVGSYINLKDGVHKDNINSILIKVIENKVTQVKKIQIVDEDCKFIDTTLNKVLTGRLCHWYVLIKEIKFDLIGNGPQFDRTIVKWGASNSLIYAYVCAGLVGIVFYLYFALKLAYHLLISYRNKEITFADKLIFFILIVIFLRTGIEVSISYWGIDQFIFLSLFTYFNKFSNQKIIL